MGFGKGESREYGTVEKNTSLCVCISIHVLYLYFFTLSLFCVCVSVCAEEGSEEKINEEGTSTSNSSLGSLSMFVSESGSSKEM